MRGDCTESKVSSIEDLRSCSWCIGMRTGQGRFSWFDDTGGERNGRFGWSNGIDRERRAENEKRDIYVFVPWTFLRPEFMMP